MILQRLLTVKRFLTILTVMHKCAPKVDSLYVYSDLSTALVLELVTELAIVMTIQCGLHEVVQVFPTL